VIDDTNGNDYLDHGDIIYIYRSNNNDSVPDILDNSRIVFITDRIEMADAILIF
jgi:hypothetical protein